MTNSTTTAIHWGSSLEAGLDQARKLHRPVLLDFSAAPM